MYRFALEKLKAWQISPTRKPLVLRGARQVGKTWLLKEFAQQQFENMAYVRLEDNDAMMRLFEGSLDPHRILRAISAATGQPIKPQSTLVILDEVQATPRALTALKYFCEDAGEYAIAVAGSLLGVALNAGVSFPVGKVNFLDLYPLNFREFLLARGQKPLEHAIATNDFDTMGIFKERLTDYLREYYFLGGMPEVVSHFEATQDFAAARAVQMDILESYQGDFAKHAGALVGERCRLIFNSLPRQLAKENKRFIFGAVKKGMRARQLDDALQFLIDSGLVVKVPRVSAPNIPLASYADTSLFKLFCVDVGLLGALAGVDSKTIVDGNELFTHFKGALTEQYVCQQLISDSEFTPYYWSSENTSSEVDFIVQEAGMPVPIEVKAEENLKSKSLASFCKKYGLTNAIRLSLADYREESWMTNVPLFACHCIDRIDALRA